MDNCNQKDQEHLLDKIAHEEFEVDQTQETAEFKIDMSCNTTNQNNKQLPSNIQCTTSPNVQPVISPSNSISSQSSNGSVNIANSLITTFNSQPFSVSNKCGIPRAACLSMDNAPVHIDVGGCIYTSSLETLTKFSESKLSKMFNGTIPIVLDTLKQHYFIDRDGKSFRHILNYMRTNILTLPDNFDDFNTLLNEAKYYELNDMIKQLEDIIDSKKRLGLCKDAFKKSWNSLDGIDLSQMSKAKQTALILRSAFKGSRFSNINDKSILNNSDPNQSKTSSSSMDDDSTNKSTDEEIQNQCEDVMNLEISPKEKNKSFKMIIVNSIDEPKKLLISGHIKIIKYLLNDHLENKNYELNSLGNFLESQKYVSKLSLQEYKIDLCLVQLMERLYDFGFILEACYGSNSISLPYNEIQNKSNHNEYIFIKNKRK